MSENVSFSDFAISDEIKKALTDMGFVTPSPIQAEAIPALLEGKDLIGQAQTGTGKTAAFGIPLIESIDVSIRKPQAIILCPTRELAIQVSEELKKISKYVKGIKILPVYGGASIDRQINDLRNGVQVIVGTPGRVIDHLNRKTLDLSNVVYMVLDEADEMLNMGFIDDIEDILTYMPESRQTVFFSATMPKPILDLTHRFQNDPIQIKVAKKELTVTNIEQWYFEVRDSLKTEAMCRLVEMYGLKMMLVFCNTKVGVDRLVEDLQLRNISAEGIHGDLRQTQRNNVLSKFKAGITSMLVATDVAARGIDVQGVDAVFNYDMPLDQENYVHRIGRTGRAGRTGKSFTFVGGRKDAQKLQDVMRYTKADIAKGTVPNGEEILMYRKQQFLDKLSAVMYDNEFKDFTDLATELLDSNVAPKNIIAALLKLQMGNLVQGQVDTMDFSFDSKGGRGPVRGDGREREDFDRSGGRRREGREGRERRDDSRRSENNEKMIKVFLNAGRNQNMRPGDIVGAIAGECGINGSVIGDIDIKDKFTYVWLPKDVVNEVLEQLPGRKIKGYKVNVEIAK